MRRGRALEALGYSSIINELKKRDSHINKVIGIVKQVYPNDYLVKSLTGFDNHDLNRISTMANYGKIAANASQLQKTMTAASIAAILTSSKAASNALLGITGSINAADVVLGKTKHVDKDWLTFTKSTRALGSSVTSVNTIVNSEISKILHLTSIAEKNLFSISSDKISSQFIINEKIRNELFHTMTGLSKSYSGFYESIVGLDREIYSVPPTAIFLPPKEFYCSTELLRTISEEYEYEDEHTEERNKANEEILEENRNIEDHLIQLDPQLLKLYRGANRALYSNNEDRIRHYSTSCRELISHILHKLAPDNKIKKWSHDSQHFHNNKPTRKARLLYINRGINNDHFNDFLDLDIKASLKLVEVFHKGIHALDAGFSEHQLRALRLKVDHLIISMIELSKMSD